ncbi:MAG: bifunctional demethylmenaquinone methyltransferase/2-methoxy-6-polyprenyl-1,4-benzoquinol methylase UbiE [Snowella sp.]|nr:bifunctional demethylmenaquinone methyltransferase/2-methoxy-6-polyprenyl-1,4-benzoquinol methylase UbiE [Snowella sp.]
MSQKDFVAATEVQAIFDRIAPVYDQLNSWLSFGQHRVWKLMTVKWCEPQAGQKALDVCCGSGDLTQLLARQIGSTGQVIGLDFSENLLAIAAERANQIFPALPITWQVGDALNLPFENDTFDCATMGYGLRNVTDIPRALSELQRVLKTGGKVAILDFHHPTQGWMQQFQRWYLQTVVVPTANYFQVTDEYAYIYPSLERFPNGKTQVKLAQQVGFSHAVHYAIAGGLMGVLVAQK